MNSRVLGHVTAAEYNMELIYVVFIRKIRQGRFRDAYCDRKANATAFGAL